MAKAEGENGNGKFVVGVGVCGNGFLHKAAQSIPGQTVVPEFFEVRKNDAKRTVQVAVIVGKQLVRIPLGLFSTHPPEEVLRKQARVI